MLQGNSMNSIKRLRSRHSFNLTAVFFLVSSLSGCWEQTKPAAVPSPPALEPPDADAIAAAVQKAVESAKSGGTATTVSGPDGTVSASFAMPGAENVSVGVSTSSNERRASASITVTFNTAEPVLLTAKALVAIETGMDYTQVAQAIGGEMTKGRLGEHYTGSFVIVQAGRRIELAFKDGKVASKKSKGID
jgi:hypothetical protein